MHTSASIFITRYPPFPRSYRGDTSGARRRAYKCSLHRGTRGSTTFRIRVVRHPIYRGAAFSVSYFRLVSADFTPSSCHPRLSIQQAHLLLQRTSPIYYLGALHLEGACTQRRWSSVIYDYVREHDKPWRGGQKVDIPGEGYASRRPVLSWIDRYIGALRRDARAST